MKNVDLKKTKKEFIMPKAEIIIFDTKDVITISVGVGGGFDGEWDDIQEPIIES